MPPESPWGATEFPPTLQVTYIYPSGSRTAYRFFFTHVRGGYKLAAVQTAGPTGGTTGLNESNLVFTDAILRSDWLTELHGPRRFIRADGPDNWTALIQHALWLGLERAREARSD